MLTAPGQRFKKLSIYFERFWSLLLSQTLAWPKQENLSWRKSNCSRSDNNVEPHISCSPPRIPSCTPIWCTGLFLTWPTTWHTDYFCVALVVLLKCALQAETTFGDCCPVKEVQGFSAIILLWASKHSLHWQRRIQSLFFCSRSDACY